MIVTLAEMKTYLGIDSGNTTNDAFLTQQLILIQSAVEAYCRRKFELATYRQTFYSSDYPKNSEMTLFHYPVVSIDSIAQDTEDIIGYRTQKEFGILTYNTGFFWGEETVVEYEAGYAHEDIPPLVSSVIYSLVQERYNKKVAGVDLNFGSDVQRISIPGTISIDFDYSLQNNERKSTFGTILGNYVNVLDYFRSERTIIGNSTLTYVEVV